MRGTPRKLQVYLEGPVKVFVVDGKFIRENMTLEFLAGGHWYVYDFIPEDEIWLDDRMSKDEVIYTLIHELYERLVMKTNKLPYEEAHNLANVVEKYCRDNDNQAAAMLKHLLNERIPSLPV